MRFYSLILIILLYNLHLQAQNQDGTGNRFVLESDFNLGYIVRNDAKVPQNKTPFLFTLNPSFQTYGKAEWHQYYGFPRVGCKITLGNLGNKNELGYVIGLTPNLTIKTSRSHWYLPSVNLGIGAAWFNKPYDETKNPNNYYIGSKVTAMAEASVQIEPRVGNQTFLTGVRVCHWSNSHYQVPNLGMNLLSIYAGILINSLKYPERFQIRDIETPKPTLHLNIRSGFGIHELARTLGPAGTPKYAIYVNDVYLSKRFGKISNVHAGLEVNYYKSFYNYIVTNNFLEGNPKFKSTVITAFLGHEFMISHFSLLTQGGINIYNKFYNAYISQYKSEQGVSLTLKKIFSSRLGVQYYLFDPKNNSRSNVFVGAYIKANFGQADFLCFQAGVVL